MDPIYKSIGGIKKGRSGALAWGASWPFAKLEIFMDKIVLTYLFFRKIELSKYDITSIKKYTVFSYGRGVHFVHHKPGVSPYLVFLTFSPDLIMQKLETAGYPVDRNSSSESWPG